MKKTIVILGLLIFGLTISGVVNAVTISDPWAVNGSGKEKNLFNIYNELFGAGLPESVGSSMLIPQLTQPGPWGEGKWTVNVVAKYAGLEQTLGSSVSGDLYTIGTNGYDFLNPVTGFTASSSFTWYDSTAHGIQDSNSGQFVASLLTQDLIDYYNLEWADGETIPYKTGDAVYLIAFEDTPTGDRDFNDLVAIVEWERLQGNVIPEPATMLLLGSGLLGMGVYARRRFKK